MKALSKLLALAGIVAAAVVVDRWRHKQLAGVRERPLGEGRADTFARPPVDAELVEDELEIIGIADVDPEPMTQVSGEGIDPDAVAAAYEESETFSDAYERNRR